MAFKRWVHIDDKALVGTVWEGKTVTDVIRRETGEYTIVLDGEPTMDRMGHEMLLVDPDPTIPDLLGALVDSVDRAREARKSNS